MSKTPQTPYTYNWLPLSPFLSFILLALFIPNAFNGYILLLIAVTLFGHLNSLCKVTLTDTHIQFDFLLKKTQSFEFSELLAYNTHLSAFSSKLIEGQVTPKIGQPIILKSIGTRNLQALDLFLSARFPSLPIRSEFS